MGKSRTVNVAVMEAIVDRLAQGQTLVDIVKDPKMPSYRAVTRAVAGDDDLWELYRKGRILQAEFYADRINDLAMEPLPEFTDNRLANAEIQRRRLEIDTLKWTTARNQPFGIRDKKQDQPQAQTFTISWAGNEETVTAQVVPDSDDDSDHQVVKH